MARSVKNIFYYIIDKGVFHNDVTTDEVTEKSKEMVDENKNTDYKIFSSFIKVAYHSVTNSNEKIPLAKLSTEQYTKVCEDFATLCSDFSYTLFSEFIKNNKDRFSLYNINTEREGYVYKMRQIQFYREVKRILFTVYHDTHGISDENVEEVNRTHETSCEIYRLLEDEVRSDYSLPDEDDDYNQYSFEKLEKMLKDLEDKEKENREDTIYIDVLEKKWEITKEILRRKECKNKREYYRKIEKKLREERFKRVIIYNNIELKNENIIRKEIKKDILNETKFDMYESPDYVELIERCRREYKKDSNRDIDVIIDEQSEKMNAERLKRAQDEMLYL